MTTNVDKRKEFAVNMKIEDYSKEEKFYEGHLKDFFVNIHHCNN